jgi:hypothetical protein
VRAFVLTGSLALALGGCFGSPPQDDEASAGTTGDATSAASSSEATDDGSDEAEGTEPMPGVSLSGMVNAATGLEPEPLAGVRVEVVGSSLSTVTTSDGRFTIENVPPGRVVYLAATPSNTYVGTIQGVDVRYADIEEIEIRQLSTLQIEQQMAALREMDPDVQFDDSRGHLAIVCDTLAASATADPLPSEAFSYSLDANGTPMLGDSTFRFFVMPLVVFANVDVSDAGVLDIAVTHPMQACTVDFSSPPTLANHLTWVPARCN